LKGQGNVTIVGVGLIGGSIGLALRSRGLAGRVVGVGRDEGRLEEARSLGAIDAFTTDLGRGVAEADVAVVCTPVDRIASDVRLAAKHGPDGLLITDAGSTKRRIVEQVEAEGEAVGRFVGAHPLAGSERNGAANARADLFEGRTCVLTPTPGTPAESLGRARSFWSSLGARPVEMTPEDHDRALARTSHLPHVLAAALAAATPPEWLGLGAGAFRDGTRVAASEAGLWTAIFLENRGPLLESLEALGEQLDGFRRVLAGGDADAVRSWWESARRRRLGFEERAAADPG
jgi:prephenate dehydrogenase